MLMPLFYCTDKTASASANRQTAQNHLIVAITNMVKCHHILSLEGAHGDIVYAFFVCLFVFTCPPPTHTHTHCFMSNIQLLASNGRSNTNSSFVMKY